MRQGRSSHITETGFTQQKGVCPRRGSQQMVLCSQCKKRPAVVFITSMHGSEKRNEGLCLVCAKKMNIPQVAEYMEHMGITDDDIEQMSEQMMDIMGDEDENFEMGGASTLPNFIQRLFTDHPLSSSDSEKPEKEKEPKKEKPVSSDPFAQRPSGKADDNKRKKKEHLHQ